MNSARRSGNPRAFGSTVVTCNRVARLGTCFGFVALFSSLLEVSLFAPLSLFVPELLVLLEPPTNLWKAKS